MGRWQVDDVRARGRLHRVSTEEQHLGPDAQRQSRAGRMVERVSVTEPDRKRIAAIKLTRVVGGWRDGSPAESDYHSRLPEPCSIQSEPRASGAVHSDLQPILHRPRNTLNLHNTAPFRRG